LQLPRQSSKACYEKQKQEQHDLNGLNSAPLHAPSALKINPNAVRLKRRFLIEAESGFI
jgi:hypothetical protein